MISRTVLEQCLARLGMLPRFPVKEAVVFEVGRFLMGLTGDDEEAIKLVEAVLGEHAEWPGPVGLSNLYRAHNRPTSTMDPETLAQIERAKKEAAGDARGLTGNWPARQRASPDGGDGAERKEGGE
jgi:hypothetical protein